jgi:elongation factor P--(R)-beta-lysine ligase
MQKTWKKLRQNNELMLTYLMREKVIDAIRAYFKGKDFREVETPLLVKAPGMEPYLEIFETSLLNHNREKHRAFLTTSPEYAMKKLLVAGMPKIFQVCKAFRNGEDLRSTTHNPEFTILEWYETGATYFDVMDECEGLLRYIFDFVHGELSVDGERWLGYQGNRMNLSLSWERITVVEAFKKYCDIGIDDLLDEDRLLNIAGNKGYDVADSSWEQAYNQIFLNEIEPNFGWERPTILYEYPASQAALSRKKKDDPRFAERFEFYVFGKEIGNAFGELTDANEQENRLRAEYEERKSLGKTMYDIDEDFVDALKVGMPDCSGIAVGVDRLVMLFANAKTVQETLWFPAGELFV